MTPEEIDQLPAGREMDALIAEKIFNLKPATFVEIGSISGMVIYFKCEEGNGNTRGYYPGNYRDNPRVPLDHYSTNIKAAWEVVEQMVARMGYQNPDFEWSGPLFKPEHRYLNQSRLGETCWYVLLEMNGFREWIMADTAPLAICRAALKAVRKDDHIDTGKID